MSQKSLNQLLKAQILDDALPVPERKKALRQLPHPSRRFLEKLIRDESVPQNLHRAASRLLVAKIATTRTPKPAPTSPVPSKLPNVETAIAESNPVIDPEAWKSDPELAEILSAKPLTAKPAELAKPARTAVLRPEGLHD